MVPDHIADVSAAMLSWRQGDVILEAGVPFLHLADSDRPITDGSRTLVAEGANGIFSVPSDVEGFVVVSQTCDVIRPCAKRPFVELAPLVVIKGNELNFIRRFRVGRYVPLKGLVREDLVADLERIITVEKGVLAQFTSSRLRGVSSDDQARELSGAIGRKRSRAALPDRFSDLISPLRSWIEKNHDKKSDDGIFISSVDEIRVRAMASWDAAEVEVELMFIWATTAAIPVDADTRIGALLDQISGDDWLVEISGRAVALTELSAATYLGSDKLDFDSFSLAGE